MNEDKIAVLFERTLDLKRKRRSYKVKVIGFLSAVLCIITIFSVVFILPEMKTEILSMSLAEDFSASIFSESNFLGFLAIGIIAFLLGITITVFCFRLKKWQDEKDREDLP